MKGKLSSGIDPSLMLSSLTSVHPWIYPDLGGIMKTKFYLFILIVLVLFGCAQEPEVPPTQLPTDTLIPPTTTPVPTATNTAVPSDTPQPTFTPTPAPEIISGPERPRFLAIPARNKLVEIWEGIPIMPEAIAGYEEYGGFYFSVEKTVTEVRQYYQQELSKSGWNLFAVGEAEDGDIKLIFQNGVDQVTITVYGFNIDFEHSLWGFKAPASVVLIVH